MDHQIVEVVEPFHERLLLIRSMRLAAKVVFEKEIYYYVTLRKYKKSRSIPTSNQNRKVDEQQLLNDHHTTRHDEQLNELLCNNALEEWNESAHTFIADYTNRTKEMNEDLQESIVNLAVNEVRVPTVPVNSIGFDSIHFSPSIATISIHCPCFYL